MTPNSFMSTSFMKPPTLDTELGKPPCVSFANFFTTVCHSNMRPVMLSIQFFSVCLPT